MFVFSQGEKRHLGFKHEHEHEHEEVYRDFACKMIGDYLKFVMFSEDEVVSSD